MENIKSLKLVGDSKKKEHYKQRAINTSPKISMLGPLNRRDI